MDTNNKLKQIAKEFFRYNANPNDEDLYYFLDKVQPKIAQLYNHDCHRGDIINELRDRGYNVVDIPNTLLNEITDLFEDRLEDNSSENGWIYILDSVIDYYEEDLEEYNLRVEE